jgi:hypothetical protein
MIALIVDAERLAISKRIIEMHGGRSGSSPNLGKARHLLSRYR